MRIVGSIEHPTYKITILEMNQRLSLQIEDGDLQQTYRFRGLDPDAINQICSKYFLSNVGEIFTKMRTGKHQGLQHHINNDDDFPEII